MIPHIAPVTVEPVALTERLWLLHRLCASGVATRVQLDELDVMCRAMESGQDNRRKA